VTDGWTPRRQALARDQVLHAIDRARVASVELAEANGAAINKALRLAADTLRARAGDVREANVADLRAAEAAGTSGAALERLRLTDDRLGDLARELYGLAEQPDPVGDLWPGGGHEWGAAGRVVRVPLGVVGVVYDAEPAGVVEAAGPMIKAGNAVVLRGAQSALTSDIVLVEVLREALTGAGLPADAVQLLVSAERSTVRYLVSSQGLIDLVVVRGGARMVRATLSDATVPVVVLGPGNCHVYLDSAADLARAERIVLDSLPGPHAPPHAAHTVLVHAAVAGALVPALLAVLRREQVTVHADQRVAALAGGADGEMGVHDAGGGGPGVGGVRAAVAEDWHTEFPGRALALGVVDSLDGALEHVARHGAGHTEVIVTEDEAAARTFVRRVDAAAVRVNAPTHEPGADRTAGLFSTRKLHARGLIEPASFTTTKAVSRGRPE
jgi:glutamate-5-semialdehyde dehydrogenase